MRRHLTPKRYVIALLLATIAMTLAMIVLLWMQFQQKQGLERIRESRSDSVTNMAFQLDREHLRFVLALTDAKYKGEAREVEDLRLRFDVLTSRVVLLRETPAAETLIEGPRVSELMALLDPLLARTEAALDKTPLNPEELSRLILDFTALNPMMQEMSHAADRSGSHLLHDGQVALIQRAQTNFQLTIAQICLLILAAVVLLLRQKRIQAEWLAMETLTVQLREAKLAAERLGNVKTEFLANMSHEIRTPMNAVLGFAFLLKEMQLPKAAVDLAHRIHTAGRSLLLVIDDILDFSKMEAGRLELEAVPFNLSDVLENTRTIMASCGLGKNLTLVIKAPPADVCLITGDPLRLGQVLNNLTTNAVKFTKFGRVELEITVTALDVDRVNLRFDVLDTGVGIDESAQKEIFAPFTQAETSTTRRFGGTGLGLVICKQLVEQMGGHLSLQSVAGEGSCFSFELSFARHHIESLMTPSGRHMNVLVASDDAAALEGVCNAVRFMGCAPASVNSEASLTEWIVNNPNMRSNDTLIILDSRMVALQGKGVAQIMPGAFTQGHRPFIFLFGLESELAERTTLVPNEVDGFVPMPVTAPALYEAMQTAQAHLNQDNSMASDTTTDQAPPLAGVRLLVVDDSETNLDVAALILRSAGAVVNVADGGLAALDWIARNHADVDIVLMDVQMPEMDGLEATRRIHQQPATAHLPVVALTAGVFAEQSKAVFDAGMLDLISKPFVPEVAIEKILKILKRPVATTPPADLAAFDPQTLLDTDMGLRIFKETEVYLRYLHQFTNQSKDQIALISAESTPLPSLAAAAHKLRGVAGNLGLNRVSQLAKELEANLLAKMPHRQSCILLTDAMQQTVDEVERYEQSHAITAEAALSQAMDPNKIKILLDQAWSAFENSDPAPAEPALQALQGHASADLLQSLQMSIDTFDMAGGKEAVERIASALDITLNTSASEA